MSLPAAKTILLPWIEARAVAHCNQLVSTVLELTEYSALSTPPQPLPPPRSPSLPIPSYAQIPLRICGEPGHKEATYKLQSTIYALL